METKLLNEIAGLRTFAVVFDTGEDPIDGLKRFGGEQRISGAQLTAIGALSSVTIGYFEWEQKDYAPITFDEQVEVLILAGNIGVQDEQARLHAHIVVGRADGSAHGGHLLEARVRPTLEVIVLETPRHLRRRFDPATGLALIDLSA